MAATHNVVAKANPIGALTAQQMAAIEQAYTDGTIRLLGTFLPMGIALFVAFAPWDYSMSPDTAPTTISIRVVLCLLLLGLWLGRSSSFVRRWHDWLLVGLLTLSGAGIATVLTLIPGGFSAASGGIALVIMFGAGAVRLPAFHTILASTLIAGVTVVLMSLSGESHMMILNVASMLASFAVLGVFYNVSSRRNALCILTSQSHLRDEKEQSDVLLRQITTMRTERLTWLENLARFLRHELKNQIIAVGTSIDLAQTGDSLAANRIYLDRAQRSLNRMRGLVASATEATSLEAALEADAVERVDWSAVVMERVSAFQLLHPSRHMTLKFRPGLSIDGNEERLLQLLDKLLGNALEHSPEDGEIRVELRGVSDGWVELAVENDGDTLPKDKERIFEAFVSSQKSTDNLGLGLFVAQSIAHNHGGRIRAEDLAEGGGARFLVRLPGSRPVDSDRLGDDSLGVDASYTRSEGSVVTRG